MLDQIAIDLLLKQDQSGLTALAKKAAARLAGELECPDCGHTGPHDDNGQTGARISYCCAGCGLSFDPPENRE